MEGPKRKRHNLGSLVWGEDKEDKEDKEEDTKSKKQKKNETEKDSADLLSKQGNHIYYYQSVNKKSVLNFTKMVRALDEDMQIKQLKKEVEIPTIHLHFNSPGGSLLQGFAMASVVRHLRCRTIGYAEGIIASAVTLPFVVCDQRIIQKYAYCLIHQLSSSHWGTYENFEDNKKNLDSFMRQISNIYLKYTRIPSRKLKEILKHDLFWDAEQCLRYRIVDEIR